MSLEELFGSILDVAPQELSDASSPATIAAWDSYAQITIVTALEEVYGVSFSTAEIQAITSLGAARRMLRAKGAAL